MTSCSLRSSPLASRPSAASSARSQSSGAAGRGVARPTGSRGATRAPATMILLFMHIVTSAAALSGGQPPTHTMFLNREVNEDVWGGVVCPLRSDSLSSSSASAAPLCQAAGPSHSALYSASTAPTVSGVPCLLQSPGQRHPPVSLPLHPALAPVHQRQHP